MTAKAARRPGVKFGAKSKPFAAQIAHARQLVEQGNKTSSKVAALLNVNRSTLWRALQI